MGRASSVAQVRESAACRHCTRSPFSLRHRQFGAPSGLVQACASGTVGGEWVVVTGMARIVMKFGGTSVANLERIHNVARHVKREVDALSLIHI